MYTIIAYLFTVKVDTQSQYRIQLSYYELWFTYRPIPVNPVNPKLNIWTTFFLKKKYFILQQINDKKHCRGMPDQFVNKLLYIDNVITQNNTALLCV